MSEPLPPLAGKVAIVTGGSEGIGAAICDRLATAGAAVVVSSRRPDAVSRAAAGIVEAGGRAIGVSADVRRGEDVQQLIDSTVEATGRIDILVNCAGGSFGDDFNRGELMTLNETDLMGAYRANVIGAFLCAKAVVPVMRAAGGGVIVNVASVAAEQSPLGLAAYGASKAALVNLTKSMAAEWAPVIRANVIQPGYIDTPRVSSSRTSERLERQINSIALGRLGTAEDVAESVVFMAGPGSAWLTGSVITLDGGKKAL